MDIKNIKFQSKDAIFPENLYFYGLWLFYDKRSTIYFPENTYSSVDHTLKAAKKYLPEARNTVHKNTIIPDVVLIASLKFAKKIPLRKELWLHNPPGNTWTYTFSLLKAVDKYQNNNVVVAPVWEKNKCKLHVVFGIGKRVKAVSLYKAMQSTDSHVSPEAKYAALYSILDVYSFDFKTNQVVEESLNN